jgi:hypothetical protein
MQSVRYASRKAHHHLCAWSAGTHTNSPDTCSLDYIAAPVSQRPEHSISASADSLPKPLAGGPQSLELSL